MGISPSVLYSHLLADTRNYVTDEVISLIEKNPSIMWPGMSPIEASISSLLSSFFKKLKVKNSEENDKRALEKFLASDIRCRDWTLQLNTSLDEVLWGEFKTALSEFYYPFNGVSSIVPSFGSILDSSSVGPGAAVGARGGDFYTKLFASRLSCTRSDLYEIYRRYIRQWPEWSNAEIIRSLHHGSFDVVAGNRLSFVPKNADISRTICIEPNLNMFYQKGLAIILEKRLRRAYGIDLSIQPSKNRSLAQRFSLDGLGVTLDLSSASDSISRKMLKEALPAGLMSWLEMLRSPCCDIPGKGAHELNMISSMGNGFTFPLETIIFSCIIIAAAKSLSVELDCPRGSLTGNFAVFGDDLAYPTVLHHRVLRLLELAGFQVNGDKTFAEGPFRESCGSDYFNGLNIRGPYIKSLESMQDLYVAINQLNLFSARTGIKLPHTVQRLLSKVDFCPVPVEDDDAAGIKMPYSFVRNVLRTNRNGSVSYSHYVPVQKSIRITENGFMFPRGVKSRIYNPSGLLISFLQRSINSCAIGARHGTLRYKRKPACSPSWDYTPTVQPYWAGSTGQQWNTAVYFNHYG
ncbi:RNA-directed RNA polymerase [ssRNA phage SRR6960803_2]|uniref:RNA-directed RNA polymerase n=1 Tax=ssRNA phage SRR6960803_2 TaxID=2786618 RepID=A0A8S5L062_9VIRU|nr:RNA-directed RNA polymerase [ssRNA phage SRR6960803_2]DAD50717.1 TPA_asm: RNA-directed RNA polymerase [ssRNA phage SRR6960803_2]